MPNPPVFLCPGQGAQTVGMGKAWFDFSNNAARTFGAADDIIAPLLGEKLSTICFEGPPERLNRTDVAQPALYVTAIASFQVDFANLDAASFFAAAGLSLGEYTALYLARAITFQDGLELVTLRGRAMQDAADASDSGMVALVGADEKAAQAVCDNALKACGPDAVLVPANFNAPGQIVISGSKDACDAALQAAQEASLRATPLPVAGAFHSPIMKPAAERLRAALDKTDIQTPVCPVISNVTARPHGEPAEGIPEGPDGIRELLVRQLTSPVRWDESCRWLSQNAGEQEPNAEFHELAPGKVLSGLMRRIDRQRKVTNHDAPSHAQA